MLTKDRKKQILKDLADKLSRQKSVVFFSYTGLKVNQFQELRGKLRENGIDCQAVKKTLTDLALAKAGFDKIKIKGLSGQAALVFGYDDEVMPAKLLYDFSKENKDLEILSGLVNGEYLAGEDIIELAKLPSRDELFAKAMGSVASPLYGLHNVLQANLVKLLFVFKNIKPEA